MLPTTQEYKISIMIGEDSFRTLKDIEIISNPNYPNEPWYSTGGLAIVFKIKMKEKFYALKCFYAEANERQERLGHIATYLKQNPSPYFVDFTYLDNELWVETTQGGNGYPVVLMEWVEGKTLDNYLAEVCKIQDKARLQNLYFQFCNLAWWLQQQPIAHGDLKHDNLIVTPEGKLKLIDYDGMFVPALSSRKASELGSPCYQHPKRDTHFFNKDLDDFSLLILQITLLALQHEPTLFAKHYNGDGILLKDTDYSNFAQSTIRALLWQLPDVKLPLLLSQLQSNLKQPQAIDLVPLLQDVEWINWLVGGMTKLNRLELKKLLSNVKWNASILRMITYQNSLNEILIKKYQEKWDWQLLSRNTALPWSLELIEIFRDRWSWGKGGLSTNSAIPWSIEIIDRYNNKWDWAELSRNKALNWSLDLIKKYQDRWVWDGLSSNEALPWSFELIQLYEDRWDWVRYGLSCNKALNWSLDLIERYQDKWNWKDYGLSNNPKLPWSLKLIEKYKDKWDWESSGGLSSNEALHWSFELIEEYEDKWNWGELSSNRALPWSFELIEKYKDKWEWGENGLSRNPCLPWSFELLEMYQDKWEWGKYGLSSNKALPWSTKLIEKKDIVWYEYEGYISSEEINCWDWNSLSDNETLPWSIELIDRHKDKWNWKSLSENRGLPWSFELIKEFESKWDWSCLCGNIEICWSIELLETYKNTLNWSSIESNSSVYEKVFKPLMDEAFIEEVMKEFYL